MESTYQAKERPGAMIGMVAGGFVFVPAASMLAAWHAYQKGDCKFRDLRCLWGVHEMLSRRCELERGRSPNYSHEELVGLTGLTLTSVRSAVARLEAAGLLSWSNTFLKITHFKSSDIDAPGVTNLKRLVPVPRRTVRLLAQCGKPAMMACIEGHLLRCVYYRDGEVVSWGRCKSSWVAEIFGVTTRSIKAARSHLLKIRWLITLATEWGQRQRWGGAFVVNLDWERHASYADTNPSNESSPRNAEIANQFSPPSENRELSSRIKNQKPPSGRPTGVSISEGEKKAPTWKHVERYDLTDTCRLLALFDSAVKAGAVGNSEHGRMSFVAAAEHALVHGTRNPCGLFVKTVKLKRWAYLTQDDEESARRRINQELYGVTRKSSSPVVVARPKRIERTHEQKLAESIAKVCEQKNLHPMVVIRAMKLDWTLDVFENYLDEAETIRLKSLAQKGEANACQ